jgi:hypothetical protein
MQQPQGFWETTLGMTLMLWLCTLPFVVLIVLPLWGGPIALVSAAVLLVAMLGICWVLCRAGPADCPRPSPLRPHASVHHARHA